MLPACHISNFVSFRKISNALGYSNPSIMNIYIHNYIHQSRLSCTINNLTFALINAEKIARKLAQKEL